MQLAFDVPRAAERAYIVVGIIVNLDAPAWICSKNTIRRRAPEVNNLARYITSE